MTTSLMKVTAMHHSKQLRTKFATLLFVVALSLSGSMVNAQEDSKPESKRPVKELGRDPFRRYEPPRGMLKKSAQVMAPTIQDRIEQYRAQKMAAINAHVPAPKPTTALLLSEIQVVGISRTPRGYAAIVEATPIKLSYVIYPGERFYDGQLVAIEDARLVFRRDTVWNDGRRDRAVEMKALRQFNPIEAMTAVKAAPASAPATTSEKKVDEKSTTSDKP